MVHPFRSQGRPLLSVWDPSGLLNGFSFAARGRGHGRGSLVSRIWRTEGSSARHERLSEAGVESGRRRSSIAGDVGDRALIHLVKTII